MDKASRQHLLDTRKSLKKNLSHVANATSKLLKPLKNLSSEQKDAVVILGLIMQSITSAKQPPVRMSNKVVLTQFREILDGICPPLGTVVITRDPCIDATVSYLLALKDCEDKGRKEADCPEAWEPGAEVSMCALKMVEEVKVEIGTLLRKRKHPMPIPWPIEYSQK